MKRRTLILPILLGLTLTGLASSAGADSARRLSAQWMMPLGFDPIVRSWNPAQRAAPVVLNNRVFVGTRLGEVWALSADSGRALWRLPVESPIEADLATDGRTLYAGSVTGTLYALDPADGRVQWRYWAAQEIMSAPVVYDDLLIFTTANNQVVAVRKDDGAWVWQYARGNDPSISVRGAAGVTVHEDAAYTGFSDGSVVKLAATDGRMIWQQRQVGETRIHDVDATPVVADGLVYAVVFGSRLLALDADDGSVRWSVPVAGHGMPALRDGTLYLGTLGGSVRAFDAETGRAGWSTQIGRGTLSTPVYHRGVLYVTDSQSGITALRAETGEILARNTRMSSGVLTPAVVTPSAVFVVSNLGHLFKFPHAR
jgi:outer membrane protein assembly factor BamB